MSVGSTANGSGRNYLQQHETVDATGFDTETLRRHLHPAFGNHFGVS